MNINQLVKEAHQNSINKGWWEEERAFGELIALMHSELSEALEEYRNGEEAKEIYYKCKFAFECPNQSCGKSCLDPFITEYLCKDAKPEGIPIELADVLIRIFDMCGKYGIDLEEAISIKMEFNKTRPHKHGGKRI